MRVRSLALMLFHLEDIPPYRAHGPTWVRALMRSAAKWARGRSGVHSLAGTTFSGST
jgi:hypothetical protein